MEGTDSMIRPVTEEEVAAFRQNGWVVLRSLLSKELVEKMRAEVQATPKPEADPGRTGYQKLLFLELQSMSRSNELFQSVAHSPMMARNAATLMRGDPEVRLFIDEVLIKDPAQGDGANLATTYHQDQPAMPFDRAGTLTFWTALVDVPPEMGSMRFYTGSHRFGPLGRATLRENDDLPNQHPWLRDLTMSEPLHLGPGDATVHNFLTVHGAPANSLERPRISYVTTYMPNDILYTGSPHRFTDDLGLEVNEPLQHPNFPLIPKA